MLGMLLGAVVLALLLRFLSDAEVSLGGVVLTSVGTGVCGWVLTMILVAQLGALGLLAAVAAIAIGLAVFLCVFYEIELWRAAVIALGYLLAQVGIGWVLSSLLQPS